MKPSFWDEVKCRMPNATLIESESHGIEVHFDPDVNFTVRRSRDGRIPAIDVQAVFETLDIFGKYAVRYSVTVSPLGFAALEIEFASHASDAIKKFQSYGI